MIRNLVPTAIVFVTVAANTPVANAHDSWINKGGYRNPAGEWCCGEFDCSSPEHVATTGTGWGHQWQ
jgi:hypothetical protein